MDGSTQFSEELPKFVFGNQPWHSATNSTKLEVRNLDFWYGEKQALFDVNLDIFEREVTAFIGPSGCGKSTLLRCLNRTNDAVVGARLDGRVTLDGQDIYALDLDPPLVRRRFGWIAQKPDPFPTSVADNLTFAAKIHGCVQNADEAAELVETTLKRVGLWGELKDRLKDPATALSGGQQQRLCIGRALAYDPEVLLMDEPCSSLDPNATALIEDLIEELRQTKTIVVITHNMQEASRVSQRVVVFHMGRIVEQGNTEDVFGQPQHEISQAYVNGAYV